jgi:hypothetical protein
VVARVLLLTWAENVIVLRIGKYYRVPRLGVESPIVGGESYPLAIENRSAKAELMIGIERGQL